MQFLGWDSPINSLSGSCRGERVMGRYQGFLPDRSCHPSKLSGGGQCPAGIVRCFYHANVFLVTCHGVSGKFVTDQSFQVKASRGGKHVSN